MTATPLSYSHDLTRDEIIARYRDRIALGKRSKLGKTDLEQLILHFIKHLKTVAGQAEIQALCDTEISLLEEGYKTSTVAFDYLPKYRKAIEQAIAEGTLPVTENNSHHYLHTQRVTGISEERSEHYALSYLKYDEATYEGLDNRNKLNNRHKQLNLKGVNPDRYLQQLQALLESEDRFQARHQAIAIAGLTGRRLNEVLARGQFRLSEHPFLLRFDGHSKTKRDAYDIVTLIEGDLLLPYLDRFRELDEIQPLLTLSGEDLAIAVNKFDVQVNRECNKYLTGIVPLWKDGMLLVSTIYGVYGGRSPLTSSVPLIPMSTPSFSITLAMPLIVRLRVIISVIASLMKRVTILRSVGLKFLSSVNCLYHLLYRLNLNLLGFLRLTKLILLPPSLNQ